MYGLDAPVGSWVISMKCENDEIYEMAKNGQVNGFSIEGIFPEKQEVSMESELAKYNDGEIEALSALCDLAQELAETKEEAKAFIKQLMLQKSI